MAAEQNYKLVACARYLIEEKTNQQEITEEKTLQKVGTGLIKIPTAIGESFSGGLLRIHDKLSLFNKSLPKTLEMRRKN